MFTDVDKKIKIKKAVKSKWTVFIKHFANHSKGFTILAYIHPFMHMLMTVVSTTQVTASSSGAVRVGLS